MVLFPFIRHRRLHDLSNGRLISAINDDIECICVPDPESIALMLRNQYRTLSGRVPRLMHDRVASDPSSTPTQRILHVLINIGVVREMKESNPFIQND